MKNLFLSLMLLLGLAANASAKYFWDSKNSSYALYVEDDLIFAGIYRVVGTEEYIDILITYDYDENSRPMNKLIRVPITTNEQRDRVFIFESLEVKEPK